MHRRVIGTFFLVLTIVVMVGAFSVGSISGGRVSSRGCVDDAGDFSQIWLHIAAGLVFKMDQSCGQVTSWHAH